MEWSGMEWNKARTNTAVVRGGLPSNISSTCRTETG